MPPRPTPLEQRVWAHVDAPSPLPLWGMPLTGPHWYWTGATNRGRPVIRDAGGAQCSARRVVWAILRGGTDAPRLLVACGEPLCVTPWHCVEAWPRLPSHA